MANGKKERTYKAPALEKGLEILELLANVREPMSLTEIATQLDRSRSELYRMTAVLVDRGYLTRCSKSDEFTISNRLFDLGMKASPVGTLVESAFKTLHELSETTSQSCHLAVASGSRMVVVARVQSPSDVGVSIRVGHHLPLCETGSGLVLLAWMGDQERDNLLDGFPQLDSQNEREALMATLEKGRKHGYFRQKSRMIHGVEDISFPVFLGSTDRVIASLTVPFLKGIAARVPVDETIDHISRSAKELSLLSARFGGF